MRSRVDHAHGVAGFAGHVRPFAVVTGRHAFGLRTDDERRDCLSARCVNDGGRAGILIGDEDFLSIRRDCDALRVRA